LCYLSDAATGFRINIAIRVTLRLGIRPRAGRDQRLVRLRIAAYTAAGGGAPSHASQVRVVHRVEIGSNARVAVVGRLVVLVVLRLLVLLLNACGFGKASKARQCGRRGGGGGAA
jgi:hypothetical protein